MVELRDRVDAHPYGLLAGQATATFSNKEQWTKAFTAYNQLAAKFGEPAVLSAAARLKAAPTDPVRCIRGDVGAKPLLHWFQAMLLDPKTVIPDGRIERHEASEVPDPKWSKLVIIRGAVSGVELGRSNAALHFRESPQDLITAWWCCYIAIDERAERFYQRFGFVGFPPVYRSLFPSNKDDRRAFR